MIPIATIGFVIGALSFAGYAYSLHRFGRRRILPQMYIVAHYILALTFFLWGTAAFGGEPSTLSLSILVGNGLILLATILVFAGIFFPQNKIAILLAALLGIALFALRSFYFPPAPYMEEGVLIFNTSSIVAVVYAALFLGVWLPANIRVGKIIASISRSSAFVPLLQSLFALSTLMAILLPAVRTVPVVTGAFIAFVVCYSVLIVVNLTLGKEISVA